MEFKDIFIMALVVGLFAYTLITFSYQLSVTNNAGSDVTQNPFLAKMFGNITKQLNESSATADTLRSSLQRETSHPVLTALGFAFTSILDAGNTFITMGVSMFGYLFLFIQDMLNANPIITGTLMAMLIGVLILAVWSLYRAGR